MRTFLRKIGVAACIVASINTFNVYADEVATGMTIYVNGVEQHPLVEPYAVDGITLVPLRTVAEALGAKVEWNQDLKRASFELHSTQLVIEPGSDICKVDGVPTQMPATVEVKNETCMVPLRFISEQFHFNVDWIQEGSKIIIEDNFEYQTSYEKDRYGHEIRTTDLPAVAEYFPYIQKDVPNWVYQSVVNAMNSNAWGMWNIVKDGDYAKLSKAASTPIEVNNPNYVDYNFLLTPISNYDGWQPETPRIKNAYEGYSMLFNFLTNTNLELVNANLLPNLYFDLFNKNSKNYNIERLWNEVSAYCNQCRNDNYISEGTFHLMPEAAFRSTTYINYVKSDNIVLPVYVDFIVKSNDKEYQNYPGTGYILDVNTQTERCQDLLKKNFQTESRISGVVYLDLILDRDTNLWAMNSYTNDFSYQLCYNVDIFDSLNPALTYPRQDIGYYFVNADTYGDFGRISKYEKYVANIIPYMGNNVELMKQNGATKTDWIYYKQNYEVNNMHWDGKYFNNPYEPTRTLTEVQQLENQYGPQSIYNKAQFALAYIKRVYKCETFDEVVELYTQGVRCSYEDALRSMTDEEALYSGASKAQIEAARAGKDVLDEGRGIYLIE